MSALERDNGDHRVSWPQAWWEPRSVRRKQKPADVLHYSCSQSKPITCHMTDTVGSHIILLTRSKTTPNNHRNPNVFISGNQNPSLHSTPEDLCWWYFLVLMNTHIVHGCAIPRACNNEVITTNKELMLQVSHSELRICMHNCLCSLPHHERSRVCSPTKWGLMTSAAAALKDVPNDVYVSTLIADSEHCD